jgi:hypothetical protein
MNSMVFRKHCKRLTVFCRKWRQSDCNPFRKDTQANLEQFLSNFGAIQFKPFEQIEKLITKINFSHPLFKAVFENRITNFQYPKTNGSFTITNTNPAALYNDDQSTLTALQKHFLPSMYFQHLLARQIQTFNSLRLSFPLSIKWQ